MKNLVLGALCCVLFIPSFSQEASSPQKQREVGLTFQNLDSYGLTYRFGKDNKLWRLNATTGSISIGRTEDSDNLETLSNRYFFSASVGREYWKTIVERLDIRYGIDLTGSYEFNSSEGEDSNGVKLSESRRANYGVGLEFLFGLNYTIKEHFRFGAAISPGIFYDFVETEVYNSTNQTTNKSTGNFWSFGFRTSGARLSLVYAF